MTTGIYFINIDDKYYIGQSVNVEKRLTDHLRELQKTTHYNYKMQNAWNLHKKYDSGILEKSTIKELNSLEILYIAEFNSIEEGLNITEGGCGAGSGITSSNSSYTRQQILEAFELLLNPANTLMFIADKTGIENRAISYISNAQTHIWLQEEFPERYQLMLGAKILRSSKQQPYKDRDNKVTLYNIKTKECVTIASAKDAALRLNISVQAVYHLLSGNQKTHNNWALPGYIQETLQPFSIKELSTGRIEVITSIKEGAERLGLNRSNLSNLKAGRQKSHKGWILV